MRADCWREHTWTLTLGDIFVGIVGALVAATLFPTLGIGGGIIAAIMAATLGAAILLLIVRLIRQASA